MTFPQNIYRSAEMFSVVCALVMNVKLRRSTNLKIREQTKNKHYVRVKVKSHSTKFLFLLLHLSFLVSSPTHPFPSESEISV